jgi:hypothetical protein
MTECFNFLIFSMMEKHEFYFETSLYEAINISELEKDFFM